MGNMGLELSADMAELLMFILGAISVIVIVAGLITRRKDGPALVLSWLGAATAVVFASRVLVWDEWESFLLIFLMAWAVGMLCYVLMGSRKAGFTPFVSRLGGYIASLLPLLLLCLWALLAKSDGPVLEHGYWPVYFIPVSAIGILLVLTGSYFVRALARRSVQDSDGTGVPARHEDQQMIVEMLRQGKVSGEEAAELLKALGTRRGPADRLPMAPAIRGAVGGAILVVIGFMLPWFHVKVNMPFSQGFEGYQAGYNVGFQGWLVLILGVLPAIMACIPALEKHVRLGLLRMVVACIGGAFVLTMLIRSPEGIGLWITAIGFGFQLVTAFSQSGFASSQPQE